MKQRKYFSFFGLLLMASMVLAACGTAKEEPTAPPTEALPVVDETFEPASVAAPSCDYGGKIKDPCR